jgi:ParB family chromosome partitioning protein
MPSKSAKPKRLGKGLDALIKQTSEADTGIDQSAIAFIPVREIQPNPYQPRQEFSAAALAELVASIREKGLIQPVTVRQHEGQYQLIAGERRLRASQKLNLEAIPAYVIEVESKEEMLEMAIVENVQREKLNPIELAHSYDRLIAECNLTQDQVAQKIGKDRSTVTNMLRLLKLDDYIKDSLKEEKLSMGHARALLSVDDSELRQKLWQQCLSGDWSVRQLEASIRKLKVDKTQPSAVNKIQKTVHHKRIESRFREVFGTQVRLYPKKQGGAIEIDYYSNEDLDRLLEIINSTNY